MLFGNFGNAVANAGKRSGLLQFGPGGGQPQQRQQRPRGLFGGLSERLMGDRDGSTFSDRLMAAGMALQGDGRGAAAYMGGLQDRARDERMMEREEKNNYLQQEQQRQSIYAMEDQFGLQRGSLALLPEDARGQVIGELSMRRFAPEEPDRPTSWEEYALTTDNPTAAGYRQFLAANPRGTNVNVNTGGQVPPDPFQQGMAEAEVEMFQGFMERAPQAQRNLQRINQLESILGQTNTGLGASARLAAANMGIQLGEGVGDLQAAQAIINSMVPEQRPAGSGPMSDADMELFRQSLPRLINAPEGNRLILETMRAINEYDAQLGQIAQAAATGQVDRAQARQMVNALNNPIEPVREFLNGSPANQGGETRYPEGTVIENDQGQRMIRRNGRWEPL